MTSSSTSGSTVYAVRERRGASAPRAGEGNVTQEYPLSKESFKNWLKRHPNERFIARSAERCPVAKCVRELEGASKAKVDSSHIGVYKNTSLHPQKVYAAPSWVGQFIKTFDHDYGSEADAFDAWDALKKV